MKNYQDVNDLFKKNNATLVIVFYKFDSFVFYELHGFKKMKKNCRRK